MWRLLWRAAGLIYLLSLMRTLYQVQFPEPCAFGPHQTELYRRHCLEPHMVLDRISLRVFASLTEHASIARGEPIWSCRNVSAAEELEATFAVPIPSEVRLGQQTLYGILQVSDAGEEEAAPLLTVSFQFTKLRPRRRAASDRSLLLESGAKAGEVVDGEWVQHWKYGRHPLTLRLVRLDRALGSPYLPALMEVLPTSSRLRTVRDQASGMLLTVPMRTYLPLAWVDDLALTRRQLAEMSRNTSMPPTQCKFKFAPASLLHFAFKKTMRETMSGLSHFLGESEIDELRWWLSDDRIYRYFVSQLIAVSS